MKKSLFSAIFTSVLILSISSTASSTAIYEYSGYNFSFVKGVYATSDSINATLTFGSPLPDGFGGDVTGLPGFEIWISDGHQIYNQLFSWVGNFAEIATDSSGDIFQWHIGVDALDDGTYLGNSSIMIGYGSGDPLFPSAVLMNNQGRIDADNLGSIAGSEGGTWTMQSAIPEPSTILLLGTGLIGVVGLARRRKS